MSDLSHFLLVACAGLAAGGMNALAGGGSFVSLPALISVGVPSVHANALSSMALFLGGIARMNVFGETRSSIAMSISILESPLKRP